MDNKEIKAKKNNIEELNYRDFRDEGGTLYNVCNTLDRKLNALVELGYADNVEELIFKIWVTVCKNHEAEISAY